jgi:hypothetical protein
MIKSIFFTLVFVVVSAASMAAEGSSNQTIAPEFQGLNAWLDDPEGAGCWFDGRLYRPGDKTPVNKKAVLQGKSGCRFFP